MRSEYYAHTSDSRDNELLIDHLRLTAELAAVNGQSFGHEMVCHQMGLLHDIGKHTESFQQVLEHKLCKQDHAIVAGVYYQIYGSVKSKWLKSHMALIMAAHHSYLYNDDARYMQRTFKETYLNDICGQRATTKDDGKQITATKEEFSVICQYVDNNQLLLDIPEDAYFDVSDMSENVKMFYSRMLYSCLVDADYSATAEYANPGYLDKYIYSDKFSVDDYINRFTEYRNSLLSNVKDSPMNSLRNLVYDACTNAGRKYDRFLTLTAPTGTGKTLALMNFALQNAKYFNKTRIIIILPYLSVIDQNSNIYIDIFGKDAVLVDDSQTEYTDESRVLSDRWSSPIVVTTSVKFFETLFSCKATDIRRLHNIANSVIVFDECQTLPSNLLNSSIEILQSLTKYYNSTVLFSTATKPSYVYRDKKYTITDANPFAKKEIVVSDMSWYATEIISDVLSLFGMYEKMKNTEIFSYACDDVFSCNRLLDFFDDEVAALYVFNTVSHANDAYMTACDRYGVENCFIITSRFCAKDKLEIISKVNRKLKNHEFVRLIATQCIEVGVDFDFPAGAREYAPFDSILQTLGRVNRNGLYNGKFLTFMYEKHGKFDYPSNSYKFASELSCDLLSCKTDVNIYDMQLMDMYYKRLFQSANYCSDREALYIAESKDCYKDVRDNYHLIDNMQQCVIVVRPINACDLEIYDTIMKDIQDSNFSITKGQMKKLAAYNVSVYYDRNFDMSTIATQLSFRNHDSYTNWYILRDTEYYTDHGFDKKVQGSNGVFL